MNYKIIVLELEDKRISIVLVDDPNYFEKAKGRIFQEYIKERFEADYVIAGLKIDDDIIWDSPAPALVKKFDYGNYTWEEFTWP